MLHLTKCAVTTGLMPQQSQVQVICADRSHIVYVAFFTDIETCFLMHFIFLFEKLSWFCSENSHRMHFKN